MAITAFIVRVDSAEALVDDLRLKFDDSARLGVPPHITILTPFMPPEKITASVLQAASEAFSSIPVFGYSLSEINRWPEVTFLTPSPIEPFIRLTQALLESFPNFPPYEGKHPDIIPHLTVAHGDPVKADKAEAVLRPRLAKAGGITTQCKEIVLIENSSGKWKTMHVIPLSPM